MSETTINIILTLASGILFIGLPVWLLNSNRTKKILAVIGGIVVLGVWIFQYTQNPSNNKKTKNEYKTEKPKTLHDFFLSDFNKTQMLGDYRLLINNNHVYTVSYIIWGDFDTKSLFFSLFLPKLNHTYQACKYFIPKYQEILNSPIKSLMDGMVHQTPGEIEERFSELSFSGRVYIYHETPLLQDRIYSLTQLYRQSNLHPVFRSKDYTIMKNSPLYE